MPKPSAKRPSAKKSSVKKPSVKKRSVKLSSAAARSTKKPGQGGHGPLHGLRVLDLSAMIAGPYAAQILADYGADVIKIETPEGDLLRRSIGSANSPDMSPLYLQLNRNKRSLVLDLKQPAARAALLALCADADVFVTNVRPAAMRRLKLGYDDMRKVNPRVVYVSVMGYGESGPYAGKPAYDDLIQGICALPTLSGADNSEPRYLPLALVDRVVGINAAHAILAAIVGRDRSGKGQYVELPMFETMAQLVLADHLAGRTFDPPIGKAGNPRVALRHPFHTSDGHVCALVYTDRHWRAFFEQLGRLDQYEAMPQLMKFAARRQRSAEANAVVADILRTLTSAEALALLERCDIPCAPLNDLDTLIEDPHLEAVGFFHTRAHPTEGRIRYTGIPSRWNGQALTIRRHAPRTGEHSLAVLKEAGLPQKEIAALLRSGATVDGAMKAKAAAAR
jgi:crotonobetainyl-CoA:carnitine CoA-transferase CaiB-like acyl-CoA transferase